MPDVTITDNLGLSANVQLSSDSPLAKAGLTALGSTAASLLGMFDKPIGQADIGTVALGPKLNSPSTLIGNAAKLTVAGTACASLSVVKAAEKNLFSDDDFSPRIPIAADDCWIALELGATVDGALGGSVDGVGVAVGAHGAISFATHSLLKAATLVKDSVATALSNFGVTASAAGVRNQLPGTVNVSDVAGSMKFSASYGLPVNINALATAALPFNYKITVQPTATLSVTGAISLSGEFVVRCHKVSATEVHLGLYKKRGTTLSACLGGGAGVAANLGSTDMIQTVLSTVLPGVDPGKAGIIGDTAAALGNVIKDGVDRSLSIAMNVACSAALTHEAAVVYKIDLAGGDAVRTDSAIASALRGDWTELDALTNAAKLRNIVKDTNAHQHKLKIHLLGIYDFASAEDFVRSCTVLHDGNGQIVITDKAKASHIAVASKPLAADPDKLRSALAEAFLSTVTYTAAAGRLQANLAVSQTYFVYDDNMTAQEMSGAVRLAAAVGLSPTDGSGAAGTVLRHARVSAAAQYNNTTALRLFYADPAARRPHTPNELTRVGRDTMRAILDPSNESAPARLRVLADDGVWQAMSANGNPAAFPTIAALSRLKTTEMQAVVADYLDITWWAEAILKVAPALDAMLSAVEKSPVADPSTDADFKKKRQKLADALADVTGKTHAAFDGGWGLAVMFALSGRTAALTMDIAADSRTWHGQLPA